MPVPTPSLQLRHPSAEFGRRSSDRQPRTGWFPVLATVAAVASADLATKVLVRGFVPLESFVPLWRERVGLWHVANPAMILGLHGDLPLLSRQVITVLAALLALTILFDVVDRGHRLPAPRQRIVWLCCGLAFGGMLGNFGERLIYWRVTDFLSLRVGSIWLPPTNVADLALFASIPLSALVIRYELEARRRRRPADG